jgi:hypothetical protein
LPLNSQQTTCRVRPAFTPPRDSSSSTLRSPSKCLFSTSGRNS